jgi:putative sterol carrier protein
MERGEPALEASVMAKLVTTELGKEIADHCLQCFGGYGYMEEYPAARLYRDARAATLAAGTSEIMREIIARLAAARASAEEEEAMSTIPSDPNGPPRNPEADPAGAASPAQEATVEAIARAIPSRYRPEAVPGWEAVFHYRIKGAEKSEWTIAVSGGRCTASEGFLGEPTCVVEMKEGTFLGIQTGALNPQAAFMMGKVKVNNLNEMMKFLKAFK